MQGIVDGDQDWGYCTEGQVGQYFNAPWYQIKIRPKNDNSIQLTDQEHPLIITI